MGQLISTPRLQAFDDIGDPLVGGKIYFYIAGSTTPKDTYTDVDLTTPATNPVILDSRGEASIYLSGVYKVTLYDSDDVLIYTTDDFGAPSSGIEDKSSSPVIVIEANGDVNLANNLGVGSDLDTVAITNRTVKVGHSSYITGNVGDSGSNGWLDMLQNCYWDTGEGAYIRKVEGTAVLVEAGYGWFIVKVAPTGVAGSTITWDETFKTDNLGNVFLADDVLDIADTDGFTFLPTCAGIPTGVPASDSVNSKALVVDKTNGDLYFYNNGWKAIHASGHIAHLSLQNADFGKGTTAPSQVILGNYSGWEYDIGDDSAITIELPHDIDVTQDIALHLTWYINEAYATANGEVQWQTEWSAMPHDETEAVDAPTHSGTVVSGDVNIPATAKYLTHDTSLIIEAANIAEADHMGLVLSRIALDGGVNPTAKPTIINASLEYTRK